MTTNPLVIAALVLCFLAAVGFVALNVYVDRRTRKTRDALGKEPRHAAKK
jgi:hypothetical protein